MIEIEKSRLRSVRFLRNAGYHKLYFSLLYSNPAPIPCCLISNYNGNSFRWMFPPCCGSSFSGKMGRFDAEIILEGKALRTGWKDSGSPPPPAFGLAGVNLPAWIGGGAVRHCG